MYFFECLLMFCFHAKANAVDFMKLSVLYPGCHLCNYHYTLFLFV